MKVFAIEKDEEQVSHIRGNRIRFDVPRVEIIRGTAPEALRDLPRAERVFIGGSDGKLGEIMQFIAETPAEIVVIHATRIETLITALAELKRADFVTDVTHLSASREKNVSEGHSLTAINPVFLIRGVR
jgi:precorrin-6B methylase 2